MNTLKGVSLLAAPILQLATSFLAEAMFCHFGERSIANPMTGIIIQGQGSIPCSGAVAGLWVDGYHICYPCLDGHLYHKSFVGYGFNWRHICVQVLREGPARFPRACHNTWRPSLQLLKTYHKPFLFGKQESLANIVPVTLHPGSKCAREIQCKTEKFKNEMQPLHSCTFYILLSCLHRFNHSLIQMLVK